MHRRSLIVVGVVAFLCVSLAHAQEPETKQAKIKRALSAALPDIAKDAGVVDMDDKGEMKVLREPAAVRESVA